MPSFSERINDSLKDNTPVPDSTYAEPYQKLVGEYSSINSGITEDGGLSSLTFKSIGYTQYAEQLELMRGALFKSSAGDLSRINDKPFKGQEAIEALKKDEPKIIDKASSQKVSDINEKLTVLLQSKQITREYGNQLLGELNVKGSPKAVDSQQYTKVQISVPNAQVDDISQVQNLDTSIYAKAAGTSAAPTTSSLEGHNDSIAGLADYNAAVTDVPSYGTGAILGGTESPFHTSYGSSVTPSNPYSEDVDMN